ncbi:MAG: DUF3224 domain-containing protein [Candidatus Limnocylindrales bacterium]
MTTRATGPFEVEDFSPETILDRDGWDLGRIRLTKRFHGDLEATGTVEMLSAVIDGTPTAYVAIEQIEGRLGGRSGGFLLQHAAPSGEVPIRLSMIAGSGRGTGPASPASSRSMPPMMAATPMSSTTRSERFPARVDASDGPP